MSVDTSATSALAVAEQNDEIDENDSKDLIQWLQARVTLPGYTK
jgi:hypothetical protein